MSRRVVLITGAARGQGRSHALRFAEQGADLVLIDVCANDPHIPFDMASADELAQTTKDAQAFGATVISAQADVRRGGEMRAVVDQVESTFGRLDVVVANAGAYAFGPMSSLEIDDDRWEAVVGTNLTGVFNTVRATAPLMIRGGHGGSIVLVSSSAARRGLRSMADYTASKHGVVGLMRTFANELGEHSIRVNSVAPTGVETYMITNPAIQQWYAENPTMLENETGNILPVGMLQADDITDAVVWLASDGAKFVTGVDLPVDAGFREVTP
ncbi:mycofactocin-coupled SDR family oxidoreductase [Aeromicrobium yanjiei]|uniref:Mycofactocin-coupled SDR family oxidoreductase n=1 Tax=Aeromicrobium yanjiei TaxID=2662028 RepID=A0A5Q2MBW5_9ACTN|nr:mycofactocin-coupled SDR family oxidoreductase [Aeromicrobium yanjiei]QGG40577.1 mycofactocin-coupled SDR family oxidoreductase [Aeromicrobium yanjiei]